MVNNLSYNDNGFLLNGEKYTVLSGAIHYFRVVKEYWYDRLKKLKNCGFNTVETYSPWNYHERKEGEFDFSGNLNISEFIQTAADLGLNVILRPGPYICAEWEMGGLPSWLLKYKGMHLRCNDPLFLEKVERYYKAFFNEIKPHLASNGGNVIAIQIENEYGSYGDDKEYLTAITEIYKKCGLDCFFFTSDGACDLMLTGGTLDGYLATANFGSRPEENFKKLKAFRPNQPLMCCEFWNGWFDHWYDTHHERDSSSTVSDFEKMLEMGASVNFYMFHGGTNFGFSNGANCYDGQYEPTVTSYDYDAPLSEAGDMTEKYFAIKEAVEKFTGEKISLDVSDSEKKAYGKLELTEFAPLFDNLENISEKIKSPAPLTMEDVGQDFGYILYSTDICGPLYDDDNLELKFDGVKDRVLVYFDGKYAGKIERSHPDNDRFFVKIKEGEKLHVDILVENMGRVNYGVEIQRESKGIIGEVRLGLRAHFGWEIFPMTFDDISRLEYKSSAKVPGFFKGILEIEKPCDTFIRPDGFEKGFIKINGFNIGRFYNSAGPQKTLYVPAPLLKKGKNVIEIFESDKVTKPYVTFTDKPEL